MARTLAGRLAVPLNGCSNAAAAGAKAARLARAAAAGLPVPDSLVVPCAVGEPVLAAAQARVGTAGVHHARLDVMTDGRIRLGGLDQEVVSLGPSLAVRSSSPAEDDPRLAGAFSSLIGVPPTDVATAVLSVWASAIRGHQPGIGDVAWPSPAPLMAVLIQPEIKADVAGTAEVLPDDAVQLVATNGPAAPLMAGWVTGAAVRVSVSGNMLDPPPPGLHCDGSVLVAAAKMAREVATVLGDRLIEWAWADGTLWLLQCRPLTLGSGDDQSWHMQSETGEPDARVDRAAAPDHGRGELTALDKQEADLVRRAAGLAGTFGERWLLPWAVAETCSEPGSAQLRHHDEWVASGQTCVESAADAAPAGIPPPAIDEWGAEPGELWRQFTAVADELTAQTWGIGIAAAGDLARQLATALRRAVLPAALRAGPVAAPDPARLAHVRTLIRKLTTHLRDRGLIQSAREFCALPADLTPILRGGSAMDVRRHAYVAALRWEPALCEAAIVAGSRLPGVPVAPGVGCGPCLLAEEAVRLAANGNREVPPRAVIVAEYALPRYAPLLVGAAGLIARGGSAAAHLTGVARSLGVPAITGCELPAWLARPARRLSSGPWLGPARQASGPATPGDLWAAVDGGTGTVHLLSASPCGANHILCTL